MTYQSEAFLAIFIQNNCKPLEKDDPRPLPQLSEQWIKRVHVVSRVDFRLHRLCERHDRVSYYRNILSSISGGKQDTDRTYSEQEGLGGSQSLPFGRR